MRFVRILYLLVVLTCVSCHNAPDYSVTLQRCCDMPEARAAATCFTYEQQAYIFAGRNEENTYLSDLWIYDAATDRWSERISTPLAVRVNAASCVVGKEAYIGLGFNGLYNDTTGYLRDWWKLDLVTGTWTPLSPYPNNRTDKAICFTTETDIYVGYGFENKYTRDMFRYHIATDTWDSVDVHAGKYDFPARSFGGTGAQVQGRFFFGTGYKTFSLDWWGEFLPEGQWVSRSAVPHGGRVTAAATANTKAVYVIGGHHYGGVGTNGGVLRDILRYDPNHDKWQYIGDLPQGRLNHVAFYIAPYIYVGLGDDEDFVPTNQLWRFQDEQ